MCGIAGQFVRHGDRVVDAASIGRVALLLAHRGPDEWGYYLEPQRRVLLIHTRLAIVDLAHGRQPLSNEDGSLWLTANGEIYDHQRLARELQARGHVFQSRSDNEVILHLYEEHGEDFVQHLRGEFAFALYDGRRRTLLLVRDRFGIKPLYYAFLDGAILFASEVKALLAHRDFATRLDPETLHSMLCTIIPPGDTVFENIKQVEPACLLRVTESATLRRRYWTLPLQPEKPAGPPDPRRAAEAVEGFRERLSEAVRLRLQGDVEVGTYLSGGIDSSSIACLMAGGSARPVKAFTIRFRNPAYDEAPFAADLARAAGLEQQVVHIDRGDLAAHFVRSQWHNEIPVMNAHSAAKFLLSALAGAKVKVVLTGEGADELLMGYPQFRHHDLLEQVRQHPGEGAYCRQLEQFLAHEGVQFGVTRARRYVEFDRIVELFGAYPYPLLRALSLQSARQAFFARTFQRRIRGRDPVARLAARLDRAEMVGLAPLRATQLLLFKTDLAGYILKALGDRAEMAHSVEGRVPFLDHPLVEYVCRLPVALLQRNHCDKHLLREAVQGLMPEGLRARGKKMFLSPSLEVLGLHDGHPLWQEYLAPNLVREVGVFSPVALAAVRHLVRVLPRGSYLYGVCEALLVFALSLHIIYDLFCRRFAVQAERYAPLGTRLDLADPAAARGPTAMAVASGVGDT